MQLFRPRRTRAAALPVFIPASLLLLLLIAAVASSGANLTATAHAQTQTTSPKTQATPPQTQATPAPTQTAPTQTQTTSQARTPLQTVSDFYKALRERRFREAFALSIYRPAIEGLSAEEFAELQPEFEKLAAAVPEKIEYGGEQISGDTATVFARVGGENAQMEVITLMRSESGAWIFGDAENQAIVKRDGKEFFLKARIDTHHREVEALLLKLANAEAGYQVQNGGQYGDMAALLASKPALREDVESAKTLGYSFQITVGKDGKSYKVSAEPLRYGRTGLLSYYMDQTGMQKKDTGGKPYNPPVKK
jgi:rare lipoprotein A (peptidoglycan hydrolase)